MYVGELNKVFNMFDQHSLSYYYIVVRSTVPELLQQNFPSENLNLKFSQDYIFKLKLGRTEKIDSEETLQCHVGFCQLIHEAVTRAIAKNNKNGLKTGLHKILVIGA
jgi:hypothetical protein